MNRSIALAALALPSLVFACGGAIADAPDGGGSGDSGPSVDGGSTTRPDAGPFGDASFPVSDAGSPIPFDASCPRPSISLKPTPSYLLFAIDASRHLSAQTFQSMILGIDESIDQIYSEARPELKVGLIVFGGADDDTCADAGFCGGPYPASADVPIALVDPAQHTHLRERIDKAAIGGTWDPLATAITDGTKSLLGTSGVDKVLFVVTGGVPSDASPKAAIDFVAHARSQDPSFATYVFGIGPYPTTDITQYDPSFLGELAVAGGSNPADCDPLAGTGAVTSGNPCYAQVNPADAFQGLADAIASARGAFECSFTIPPISPPIDPTLANIEIDDGVLATIVPLDPTDGWTFDDPHAPTRIRLHGSTCARYTKDPSLNLTLVFGCAVDVRN